MTNNISMSCAFNGSAQQIDNRLKDLVANRNSFFHLDLSGNTMIQVLESSEMFHKKYSPKYTLSPIIMIFKMLEDKVGQHILPIDVNDMFYVILKDFLLQQTNNRGENLKPSTIKTYFQTIQSTLNWASKHNCQISETYNVWKIEKYEKSKIALTPSEIAHIYYFDLDNKKTRKQIRKDKNFLMLSFSDMKKIRDHFVLACNLGQRYSDSCRFDQTNFDKTRTIFHCIQQKTGNKAVVNLSKMAIDKTITFEILNRYDFCSPVSGIDINTYNRYLHLLCKTIGMGFSEDKQKENKINGEMVKERRSVWSLISSHTARRTFITYWVQSHDVSIVEIQKCTGHSDIRQISNYSILDED